MKRNYVLLYLSTTKFLLYKGRLPLLNVKALVFVFLVLYNGAFPPICTTMKLLENFPRSLAKFLISFFFFWSRSMWKCLIWWIVSVVWMTEERYLVLLPARTTVRDLTITNLWHDASRIWTCAEPEFWLCMQ